MQQGFNFFVGADLQVVVAEVKDVLALPILVPRAVREDISVCVRCALIPWIDVVHIAKHTFHTVDNALHLTSSGVVKIVAKPLGNDARDLTRCQFSQRLVTNRFCFDCDLQRLRLPVRNSA